MRLFVGIALADMVMHELQSVAARLRSSGGPAAANLRWTAPDSWHITLQFLGNATAEQFPRLTARLSEVRSRVFPVELGALGCFDRAGVLFVDVNVSPELAALAERVVEATSRCGFVAETRPFHPHITLARRAGSERTRERGSKWLDPAGRGGTLKGLVARTTGTPQYSRFTAKEFLLYESHLSSGGSRYEVLGRFPLGQL